MTDDRLAFLALGSNLGDRLAHLQLAVDTLGTVADLRIVGVSPVVETAPVGGPDQGPYLNAVLAVQTPLSPREILNAAHLAEQAAARVRDVRWGPRTLDVDVLSVGDLRSDDEVVLLPHPRLHERAFVLVPWALLDPTAVVPDLGVVGDLAAAVGSDGVELRADLVLSFPVAT